MILRLETTYIHTCMDYIYTYMRCLAIYMQSWGAVHQSDLKWLFILYTMYIRNSVARKAYFLKREVDKYSEINRSREIFS